MLLGMRRMISADTFFLSQLDNSYDEAYGQLQSAMVGFLRGWLGGDGTQLAVDKNRAWLHCIEMLLQLAPEAKVVVCIRELGQIYGSIEARHQNSILLDFNDGLADYDRFGRADILFAKDRVIGAPLISIHAIPDFPESIRERIFILKYEDLTSRPREVIRQLYRWLGAREVPFDSDNLPVLTKESDSHYHMKYQHSFHKKLENGALHDIPPRIQHLIQSAYAWYYKIYYPNAVN